MKFPYNGIAIPEILLPGPDVDLSKWAVVACDQYTSQREYWAEVARKTQGAPSALNIIYPEAWLDQGDGRIEEINRAMAEYERDVLTQRVNGFVLVERTTQSGSRLGLMAAVDLEAYDFYPGSVSQIRATEGTVLSRIPPRVKIRKNAPLESPHIMLLVDDVHDLLIRPLYEDRGRMELLYDVNLMMEGGRLRGWRVDADIHLESVQQALYYLNRLNPDLPYAVEDGKQPLAIAGAPGELTVSLLQPFLDNWLLSHSECEIDYIHGEQALRSLAAKPGCCGSVVACDQYTSEPDYWKRVEDFVGEAPSTLHITLPEVYLEGEDLPGRIQTINRTMEAYLQGNLLQTLGDSFLYVERTLADKKVRKGLVGAVDLEQYDYARGSQSLIRATEGTVLERIPPRVKVRENAALELPHIMLLVDDQARTVIEPLGAQTEDLKQVYDFALMENGGSIRGWQVPKDKAQGVQDELKTLADQEVFEEKYQVAGKGTLLFAVGDGNHSLATARQCWLELKESLTEEQQLTHPARYALAEIVNLHDPALVFEPIHRLLRHVDGKGMIFKLNEWCGHRGLKLKPCMDGRGDCLLTYVDEDGKLPLAIDGAPGELTVSLLQPFLDNWLLSHSECEIDYIHGEQALRSLAAKPGCCGGAPGELTVSLLQPFLDNWLLSHSECEIDYIHGEQALRSLAAKPGCCGFLLTAMDKKLLFPSVKAHGALPRKTFSMGEANEKRYYMECRRLHR